MTYPFGILFAFSPVCGSTTLAPFNGGLTMDQRFIDWFNCVSDAIEKGNLTVAQHNDAWMELDRLHDLLELNDYVREIVA